ncbi:MAG: hypothetical protein BWZ09_02708 [Alphaproteobacteria bacterium ADurb.BinA305]|nr:MAG: hypothetical protein BWZ09_02708 [Alphaproteobacteria bacterium ADurb.BinA305]
MFFALVFTHTSYSRSAPGAPRCEAASRMAASLVSSSCVKRRRCSRKDGSSATAGSRSSAARYASKAPFTSPVAIRPRANATHSGAVRPAAGRHYDDLWPLGRLAAGRAGDLHHAGALAVERLGEHLLEALLGAGSQLRFFFAIPLDVREHPLVERPRLGVHLLRFGGHGLEPLGEGLRHGR